LSLPFMMKVMVCHFVSDSHEVMTALIVVLPLIVVVEISLQLHWSYHGSWELMKSVGCHGRSLVFTTGVDEGNVWHFVSDSYRLWLHSLLLSSSESVAGEISLQTCRDLHFHLVFLHVLSYSDLVGFPSSEDYE
jgi:hypothetical protein